MFFAKGEIIMNSIYKVIWSKAKNCYVVASEIARSHTKSASGSEKIGGVARHALLALGAVCAIACGGFVNVGAADTVDVTTTGSSTATVYTKEGVDRALTHYYTTSEVNDKIGAEQTARDAADQALNQKIEGEMTTRDAADQALDQKIEANKTAIGDLKTKAATTDATLTNLSGRMAAAESDIDGLQADVSTAKSDIGTLKADVSTAKSDINTLKAKDTELSSKIDTETANRITSDTALDHKIDAEIANRITSDTALDQKIDKEIQDRENAINATDDRTGGIARNLEDTQTTIEGIVKVDNQGNVKDVNELSAKKITTTDDAVIGGKLGVIGETTLNDKLTAKGEATFEKNVTAEKDLTVKGTLNTKDVAAETIHISKSEDTPAYKSEGSIIGEGGNLSVSNKKTDKSTNITKESELNVNEEGTVNWATSKDNATGNVTEGRSEVKADHIKNSVKKTEGGTTFGYEENITETGKVGTATDKDGNRNELTQTATGTENTVTSKDGNKSTTKQEAGSISSTVYDKDGNVKASSEMKEDGSISNNATGDMTNTVGGNQTNTIGGNQTTNVTGDISNTAKNITNEATGTLTDQVGTNTRVTTSNSITDTVGTANRKIENDKITDTAGDSTVVTENEKGTTFTKTGSTAYSTAAGAPTDTNIAGNHITTGRVDANELGVSDKDGANTADFSVEAGERKGVKASADNGTTTGSLDVTAEEVSSSVKDASGKGSTFKQRIDAIMMESKNVSITAEEKLTNEAKDIVTNASHSITEKVGDTNVTEKTTTSSKSEIQNADTITSVQQTESMVQSYVGKKDGSATNVTTNFANASANQVTENGQTSTVLNNKDGLLIRNTANGSSFTTADGTNTGRASEWTNVKGNEISTGKVEANYVKMDYADVMRDLGVRGNAKIAGKTTTGSLEVTGTSTLTGDVTMGSNATVEKNLNVKGTTTTKTLTVTENATVGGTLDVTQKATFHDDVDITKDLSVGGNATITGDVTANSYKVGDKTYISADGINANNQKITNVADGSISEGSKDAVNGGQLYQVKNDLEGKVNKVGANAAAMANLHPMEFDPDSKWNIAAAMGNYGSETATAIGAFYRPNEDVMVNFSTAFGTGENMVGGGVSVRLGKGSNKLSREESNALKAQVNDLTARMDALLSVLNPNMSKDFPDVPENHWAYEAVSRLAGNDIVQGYPDGEFHGERTMTRYEMAEIIYNALSRGAEAEKELVEEFKPELQAMAASEKSTAEKAEG